MAQNPAGMSLLDAGQIVKRVYDEANDRIRVDAEVTANISGSQEVIINANDDSIAVRGSVSGNELEPNLDGSINTLVLNSAVPVKWDAFSMTTPNATTEVYAYKTGGLAGTLVATLTVVYTDSSKDVISSLVRT